MKKIIPLLLILQAFNVSAQDKVMILRDTVRGRVVKTQHSARQDSIALHTLINTNTADIQKNTDSLLAHNTRILANTNAVNGHTTDIATNASNIASHTGNTSNPHSVTAAQVGLGTSSTVQFGSLGIGNAVGSGRNVYFEKLNTSTSSYQNIKSYVATVPSSQPGNGVQYGSGLFENYYNTLYYNNGQVYAVKGDARLVSGGRSNQTMGVWGLASYDGDSTETSTIHSLYGMFSQAQITNAGGYIKHAIAHKAATPINAGTADFICGYYVSRQMVGNITGNNVGGGYSGIHIADTGKGNGMTFSGMHGTGGEGSSALTSWFWSDSIGRLKIEAANGLYFNYSKVLTEASTSTVQNKTYDSTNTLSDKLLKMAGVVRRIGGYHVQKSITADGNENTITEYSFTIPANTIGPNGWFQFDIGGTVTNNANAKTIRIKFNGTTVWTNPSLASTAAFKYTNRLYNRNSLTAQVGSNSSAQSLNGNFGTSGTAGSYGTFTIDTGAAISVTVTVQGTASDNVTIEFLDILAGG